MESIYGDQYEKLCETMNSLLDAINAMREEIKQSTGMDPVEHCLGRIKSEESMREKCRRQGLPETPETALGLLHDAIGVRVVCAFIDDVYEMRDRLAALPFLEVVEEKDYIRRAKPNGYRSLHMIVRVNGGCFAEIQLRTISMDTWAALEHHMKYKKNIRVNTDLITSELKRCADELASTDASLQAIRDMIRGE